MIERETMEQIRRVLVEEAQTDALGLWSVLWQVKEDLPSLTPDEARQATLTVIREALAGNQILPGEFVDHDEDTSAFVAWPLSADEAVRRIEREWAALGREPNLGDVVWFVGPGLLPLAAQKHPMGRDWKPK